MKQYSIPSYINGHSNTKNQLEDAEDAQSIKSTRKENFLVANPFKYLYCQYQFDSFTKQNDKINDAFQYNIK